MKWLNVLTFVNAVAATGGIMVADAIPLHAQQRPLAPFTAALSNTAPLVFGMSVAETEFALRSPLTYISGPPGDEVFLVIRNVGGSGFSFRNDPLFLQFRRGRLTGWKGDWDRRWLTK